MFAVLVTAITVLTVVPAVLQGRYLNRWQAPEQLTSAASRLSEFPTRFGDWEFVKDGISIRDSVVEELGIGSYVNRIYRHRPSGAELGMLLMTGQPGPLVRHPPHVCYAMEGNVVLGETEQLRIPGTGDDNKFALIRYESNSYLRGKFSVAYGYSVHGTWDVPAWPRIAYGGNAALYKMQVIGTGLDAPDEPAAHIPEFLADYAQAFTAWIDEGGPPPR